MAVIEARGLGKSYEGKAAVTDLSFDVQPGSVTGFLGPNGAGKSTTMRLMLGLDHGAGTTTFDGVPFTSLDRPMHHVGVLLEAKPFHPTRKARNHLRMQAVASGIPTRRVDEVLEQLGLTAVARKKPKTFSLGMGQRLGLAAALLGDPHTLILDEPANGLDPQGIQWIRELLKGFAAQGRSVFVSSHLLSEMALMADQLVVIGRGRLIASGPVGDFVRTSRRNAVLVRSPQAGELADLARAEGATVEAVEPGLLSVVGLEAHAIGDLAFEGGIRIHELAARTATLEEAFLEATEAAQEFEAHVSTGDGVGVSSRSLRREGSERLEGRPQVVPEDEPGVSRRSQARSSTTGEARSSTTGEARSSITGEARSSTTGPGSSTTESEGEA